MVAHREAAALRRHHHDVDGLRRDDPGVLAEDDAEAVREVEAIAGPQPPCDLRPHRDLGRVAEEVLDDRPLLGGVLDAEQVLALLPAVLEGAVHAPSGAHPDEDAESLVAEVEALAPPLRPVSEDGGHLLTEDGTLPLDRIVAAFDDLLGDAVDLDGLHDRH